MKRETSDRFYQRISSLAQKKRFPLKAIFELTYRCNFNCIHCYVVADKDKKELSTKQVKEILDRLRKAGCFHVGLTGGEPLIREDIFEILNYAKVNGFRISLLTNGYLVNEEAAKRIASLGTSLNRVDVSVLGATKKTLEKITGKRGSFEKVMDAIRLLKAEGVDTQIKATLMKPNQDEFLKIKELARQFDTMFRYSPTINQKTNGDKSPLKYQVDPEDVYRIRKRLSASRRVINEQDLERWNPKSLGRKRLFRCGAGQTEVSISPYGEMNLCLEIHYPQYNILKGAFKKGWGKIKKIIKEFRPPDDYACSDCLLASFCHWCPARNWFSPEDFTRCSQYDREMALVEARLSPLWKKIAQCQEIEKAKNVHKRPGV